MEIIVGCCFFTSAIACRRHCP